MTEIQVLRHFPTLLKVLLLSNSVLFYDRDTGIETPKYRTPLSIIAVLFYDRDTGIETF